MAVLPRPLFLQNLNSNIYKHCDSEATNIGHINMMVYGNLQKYRKTLKIRVNQDLNSMHWNIFLLEIYWFETNLFWILVSWQIKISDWYHK